MKQASFNFTFIAVDAIMLICLAIAYTLHMFLLTRKSVHYNQYTAFVSSIEISPIKNIRCNIYFDDCNGNRIHTKTHYVFYSWQLVDFENSVNNTVTLPILYNSATGQVIVLTNPSKWENYESFFFCAQLFPKKLLPFTLLTLFLNCVIILFEILRKEENTMTNRKNNYRTNIINVLTSEDSKA